MCVKCKALKTSNEDLALIPVSYICVLVDIGYHNSKRAVASGYGHCVLCCVFNLLFCEVICRLYDQQCFQYYCPSSEE